MGKDYGEPLHYDPRFNGPVHKRSCTDIIWLIIFILFLGVWVYVGVYSIRNGDVKRLLAPMDSQGRRCGLDSGVMDKKYLVFFDITRCLSPEAPITGCPTPQVCVDKCPDETIMFEKDLQSNWPALRSKMVCTENVHINSAQDALNYIAQEKCASYVIQSEPVIGRCFINVTEAINNIKSIKEELNLDEDQLVQQLLKLIRFQELSSQIVEDLVQSRWYITGALLVVVLICFIYIILLRWVVGPVVWVSITGLIALLGFALYLCYKNYAYYKANPVTVIQTTNLKGYAESWFTKQETWLVLMIILSIIVVILVLMVIFLRNRITIAIALIREGSKAVAAVKSTIAFPVFPWILQCGIIACGIIILMYLLSIGESSFKVVNLANDTACQCTQNVTDYSPCNPMTFPTVCHQPGSLLPCRQASCHFVGIDNPHYVGYLHLINLVGFFWAMFFIQGISDMMLASTFSTWYWTFNKRDLPFFTLTSGICRTVSYHMGTVALGSLIITIVRVIRVILEYVDHKLKKFDNAFTRCIMCFCKCCFYCLENFLKFINKNAYIMCAVHGKNFCTSARDAFSLLMRNIVRVVVLDKVTDFIFFLSKLLISIGVGMAVYYIQQWNYIYEITKGERLHYYYVPAIILSIATYLITTIFFNVYSMSVDTLFLCFLEDCERNDGSPEKPYFMSKNLMKILGKKNKHS